MTGDEFTARYRLRQQLGEGDVVSFRATDARGQAVLVHVLKGESVEPFDAATLDDVGRAQVREVLEVEGLAVVVTDPLEAFSTFEAWREARRAGEEEPAGAFTRIFKVVPDPPVEPSQERAPPGPSADQPAPPAPGSPSAADSAGSPEALPAGPDVPDDERAGEFTRRFGALDRSEASGPPSRQQPPAPLRPPEPSPPPTPRAFEAVRRPDPPTRAEEEATGVFTRIMGSRPAELRPETPQREAPPPPSWGTSPPASPRPASPPASSSPSSRPASPPPPPPDPRHAPADSRGAPSGPPPPRDPHAPGPFTLAMKGYRQPSEPPPSMEPGDYQVSDDYLSNLHGRPGPGSSIGGAPPAGPGAGGASPPEPAGPRRSVPPVPSGPSEYTRVIRGGGFGGGRPPADPLGSRGAPPPAPVPPPPPDRAPASGSKTGIIVALVLVVAAMVAVVAYFALRPPAG